ncbi:MAG: sulfur carrier protein ThiS [Acidobacteriota bacterium]|nr:sulfur carrier protein ThiS [Acidobacteriota bacterium]MDH3522153.1 sulfur carrier protein ThiS [Acidobacteriota bacterium]
MKRWIPMFIVGALIFGVAAFAQGQIEIILNGEATQVAPGTTLADLVRLLGRDVDDVDVTYNGEAVKDRDLDDIIVQAGDRVSIVEEDDEDRFGLGIGIGLVNLDEEFLADDVETYLTVHLRIAFGDPRAHRGSRPGLRGYLEPEIGYWQSDTASDTLLGINIIGSFPFNALDFFVGAGAGIHMLETDAVVVDGDLVQAASDDTAFGVNAQFGVDVHLTETVTVFGTGRFDIIDSADKDQPGRGFSDSLEAKVYLGLRFRF